MYHDNRHVLSIYALQMNRVRTWLWNRTSNIVRYSFHLTILRENEWNKSNAYIRICTFCSHVQHCLKYWMRIVNARSMLLESQVPRHWHIFHLRPIPNPKFVHVFQYVQCPLRWEIQYARVDCFLNDMDLGWKNIKWPLWPIYDIYVKSIISTRWNDHSMM